VIQGENKGSYAGIGEGRLKDVARDVGASIYLDAFLLIALWCYHNSHSPEDDQPPLTPSGLGTPALRPDSSETERSTLQPLPSVSGTLPSRGWARGRDSAPRTTNRKTARLRWKCIIECVEGGMNKPRSAPGARIYTQRKARLGTLPRLQV